MEKMELESFPFDIQDLTVTLVCNYPTSVYVLAPDPDENDIGIMREKLKYLSTLALIKIQIFDHGRVVC